MYMNIVGKKFWHLAVTHISSKLDIIMWNLGIVLTKKNSFEKFKNSKLKSTLKLSLRIWGVTTINLPLSFFSPTSNIYVL